jgi:acylglycerol lipase
LTKVDVADLRATFKGAHELVQASDGKTLFVRRWNAKNGEPKASVLIFHGITAYSAPYGPLIAEELSAQGFDVFGMDLRGHGLSDGTRGDYPSSDRLVKDLTETVQVIRAKSMKLVLLGHSLGVLSAIAAANNSQDYDGLILLSAARKMRTGVYRKPKTSDALKLLFAVSLLRSRPMIPYARSGMVGLDDPLFNFEYSARFYSVFYGVGALSLSRMFRSGTIDSPNLKFKEKLRVPLLLGVGESDELFTPEYVREFYEQIDCDNKQFFEVPGARHAYFPKGCWTTLVSWLQEQFSSPQLTSK